MTKQIRIENADTSAHEVEVEVWNKSFEEGKPDTLERTVDLKHPTSLATECIHQSRYLVVKEKKAV